MNKKNNAIGTVGFIFIAMMLAKILGQVREIVIAGTYGTAWMADAYVAASQIPTNFFDMILGSAVSASFIPVFNKFMKEEGEQRAKRFAGAFFNVISLVTIILSVCGVAFAPLLIKIFTPGISGETAALAVTLLRIMFPMIIFIGAAFTFVGILQSMGEYNLPAVMSMVSSGACIIYLLTLNNKFGITGLATSLLIGWILQFIILTPSTLKKGFRFNTHIADSGIKNVAVLALPVLIGTWVQPINVMINTWIASSIGGVSAINYANKLYLIAAGVFAMSVTNYIFPKLSRLSISEEDKENWMEMFMTSVKTVIFVVAPIAVIFITESGEIIRVIYQRGQFDEKSVAVTGGALLFYSIGILPYALQEVMYKSFYSRRNSKVPMLIALTGIAINIPLSFILSRLLGVNGLALATSLAVITTMVISFVVITKDSGHFGGFFKELLKILFMAAAAGAVIMIVKNIMISLVGINNFAARLLVLAAASSAGAVVYIIMAFIMKIPAVTGIVEMLKKRGGGDIQ
ncbi:MAG: murein biosynthesis integral membrane protein MurJ [Bacillota bacterium]|nr:murein biosynthesis integral membrane protein MurJ [Bacillota bacterium]